MTRRRGCTGSPMATSRPWAWTDAGMLRRQRAHSVFAMSAALQLSWPQRQRVGSSTPSYRRASPPHGHWRCCAGLMLGYAEDDRLGFCAGPAPQRPIRCPPGLCCGRRYLALPYSSLVVVRGTGLPPAAQSGCVHLVDSTAAAGISQCGRRALARLVHSLTQLLVPGVWSTRLHAHGRPAHTTTTSGRARDHSRPCSALGLSTPHPGPAPQKAPGSGAVNTLDTAVCATLPTLLSPPLLTRPYLSCPILAPSVRACSLPCTGACGCPTLVCCPQPWPRAAVAAAHLGNAASQHG